MTRRGRYKRVFFRVYIVNLSLCWLSTSDAFVILSVSSFSCVYKGTYGWMDGIFVDCQFFVRDNFVVMSWHRQEEGRDSIDDFPVASNRKSMKRRRRRWRWRNTMTISMTITMTITMRIEGRRRKESTTRNHNIVDGDHGPKSAATILFLFLLPLD